MKLDFNLEMQQEQKLIMTQELQLSVKILQLTSYELGEFIDEQLTENPLLEIDEKEKTDLNKESDEFESYLENHVEDYYEPDYYEKQEKEDEVTPFHFISNESSLWDYLKEQLSLTPMSKRDNMLAEYIIDNIDEHGYLSCSTEEIAKKNNIPEADAERILNAVQEFDPPGIGARNLTECLIIQVRLRGICEKTLERIISENLQMVAEGKTSKLAKLYDIPEETAEGYIEIIKSLDPKPGIRFSSERTRYVIPDVIIEKIEGKYVVSVNEDNIPELKVNKLYRKIITDRESPEYKYVRDKLQSAIWIIKSIEQRITTIKRVVEAIIEHQIDFFDRDLELKPMTLKQIATEIGMHESTVSRAVKGKYAETPKGIFEIKNFFIRGMCDSCGGEISTDSIKNLIKEIITGEQSNKPYSDQDISDMLGKRSIKISRRTVAKYREEMFIPSSSKRKK